MTAIEQTPAPLSLESIMRKITLTDDQRQAVATVQARYAELLEIIRLTEPDRHGRISALHAAADAAEAEYLANPTLVGAEKFHAAIVRHDTAKLSFARIDAGCHAALANASRELEPVSMAVLDAALASLDGEAGRTRAALVKTASVFADDGEIGIFDSRLAVTRANLEGERTDARRDPLNWLRTHGFAE